jgi:hypothetical protein
VISKALDTSTSNYVNSLEIKRELFIPTEWHVNCKAFTVSLGSGSLGNGGQVHHTMALNWQTIEMKRGGKTPTVTFLYLGIQLKSIFKSYSAANISCKKTELVLLLAQIALSDMVWRYLLL